jgi:hypothetical protein
MAFVPESKQLVVEYQLPGIDVVPTMKQYRYVKTSGYGKSSFDFAAGKPLELLSGTNLLYLLAENAGIEAKIEPPDDWVDPEADAATDERQVDASSIGAKPVETQPEL